MSCVQSNRFSFRHSSTVPTAEHVGVPLAAWCRRMSPPTWAGARPRAPCARSGCGVGVGCGVSAVFTQQSTLRA